MLQAAAGAAASRRARKKSPAGGRGSAHEPSFSARLVLVARAGRLSVARGVLGGRLTLLLQVTGGKLGSARRGILGSGLLHHVAGSFARRAALRPSSRTRDHEEGRSRQGQQLVHGFAPFLNRCSRPLHVRQKRSSLGNVPRAPDVTPDEAAGY